MTIQSLSLKASENTKEKTAAQKTSYQAAWVVTLTAALFFFYEFIQLNIFNAINVELMQAFNLNAAELGQLSSMYFYANAILLFPAGILLDRFSTRKMLFSAVFVSTVGTFVFGLAETYAIAAIGRFLVGVGAAFCFLSCIRLASRWFPPSKMAFVTGLVVTMAMLGGLVAQTPFTALSHLIGWRHAVLLDACLGVFVAIAVWFLVKDRPPNSQANESLDKAKLDKLGFWHSLTLVLLNPQNWLGGVYTSLMNLPIFLLGALWGIPYLVQVHHLSPIQASYATTMLFLGVIVGSPLFGWFSDYIGRRVLPMIVGAVLSFFAMCALLFMHDLGLPMLATLFFLIGLVTSSQVLSYPTIAELNPIALTSTAVSIDSVLIMVSGVLCQPFFGWILESKWDHTVVDGMRVYTAHDFMNAMLVMPISFALALVLAFFIKETYCKSQA